MTMRMDEIDERLLWLLRRAGDEWGPAGVAKAAARLAAEGDEHTEGWTPPSEVTVERKPLSSPQQARAEALRVAREVLAARALGGISGEVRADELISVASFLEGSSGIMANPRLPNPDWVNPLTAP